MLSARRAMALGAAVAVVLAACSSRSGGPGATGAEDAGPDGGGDATAADAPSGDDSGGGSHDGSTGDGGCAPFEVRGTPSTLAITRLAEPFDPALFVVPQPSGPPVLATKLITTFDVLRGKLDADFNCPSATLAVAGVATDAQGNVYVGGTYRFHFAIASAGADAGTFTADGSGPDGGSGYDVFLAKLDPSLDVVYLKTYLGTPDVTGMAVGSDGTVWLAGTLTSPVDFGLGPLQPSGGATAFLAALDASGAPLLSETLDATTAPGPLALTSAGPVLSAYLHAGNPNGAGVALLAFDAQGKSRWSKAFQTQADPNGTPPTALVTDSADELALTGSFLGSIDFGGGALPANPQANGASPYVAKVSSMGAYVGAHTLPVGGSLAMRADGTVALATWVEQQNGPMPLDFGRGPVTPPEISSYFVVVYDTTLKVTGSTAFATAPSAPYGCAVFGTILATAYAPSGALLATVDGDTNAADWVLSIGP